jgi:hypothetical protein
MTKEGASVSLESRTRALLDLVQTETARRRDAILGEAHDRAGALLKQAQREARDRVRQTFAQERQRSAERVATAQAQLDTRRRLYQQRRASALLALAWQRLPDVLLRRWEQDGARRTWVGLVVTEACAVLPHSSWTIAHPPAWSTAEQQELAGAVSCDHGVKVQFVADPAIRAGLKISADGNLVDGSADGLIADQDTIGGRLLHRLEATP